jgi:hypothetical protein
MMAAIKWVPVIVTPSEEKKPNSCIQPVSVETDPRAASTWKGSSQEARTPEDFLKWVSEDFKISKDF